MCGGGGGRDAEGRERLVYMCVCVCGMPFVSACIRELPARLVRSQLIYNPTALICALFYEEKTGTDAPCAARDITYTHVHTRICIYSTRSTE